MTLMNNYFNSYCQKLARAGPDDPNKIHIDGGDFQQIIKDVNADTYNPYVQANVLRNEIRFIQEQSKALNKIRAGKGVTQIEKTAKEEEERKFTKMIKQIVLEAMPNPDDIKRNYKKGISTNKFTKYKQVLERKHE